jgi:hypothetical protein
MGVLILIGTKRRYRYKVHFHGVTFVHSRVGEEFPGSANREKRGASDSDRCYSPDFRCFPVRVLPRFGSSLNPESNSCDGISFGNRWNRIQKSGGDRVSASKCRNNIKRKDRRRRPFTQSPRGCDLVRHWLINPRLAPTSPILAIGACHLEILHRNAELALNEQI